jgi:hypothetical protein
LQSLSNASTIGKSFNVEKENLVSSAPGNTNNFTILPFTLDNH